MTIAKTASKIIRALIPFLKFLSPKVGFYLSKSPYDLAWNSCHVLVAAFTCYLHILGKGTETGI